MAKCFDPDWLEDIVRCVVCGDYHEKGSYHKRMEQQGTIQVEVEEWVCDECVWEYAQIRRDS